MRNALDGETSPYLLQHRDNPVHWQPWSEEALATAVRDNKPILLSVGYAACHWCHVMAHESFEDETIAAVMNEHFVNIKVDREERPDVDAIYQSALALTGQQGGWPLTMFLTPQGEPFWGGTYFPSTSKYGRPGFPDVLKRVSEVYHNDQEAVRKNTAALTDALARMAAPTPSEQTVPLNHEILDEVARRLVKEVDPFLGGIGQAPKFPQAYAHETLWRAWLRTKDEIFLRAVDVTLTQMAQGGIYDHLAGGFSRYATDDRWLIPHFEKMLYDNALLLDLLTQVWQGTGKPLYRQRIEETIDWLASEMVTESGGFAASYDADSEGEEGRFYVWQEAEIDALLGADAPAFKRAYGVGPGGNWEGATILNRSHNLELGDDDSEALLTRCRQVLRRKRAERIWPGWDDKVLADWNGLAIAALANAAAVFERPDWSALAVTAFDAILAHLSDGDRLHHAYRDGRTQPAAMLDDYANMARAALALYEHLGRPRYLERARAWMARLDAHYWDPTHGGYFYSADDATDLITRMRHCHDNAIPAGNATAAGVLTRLWLITGDESYRARADAIFDAFAPELLRNFFPMTSYLNQLEFMMNPVQVVIRGERDGEDTKALLRAMHAETLPDRLLQLIEPDAALPATHPAAGKGQIDGRATAYVCVGPVCSLPVNDPAALTEALQLAR